MVAAEARAAWQRTANRCFVQEDAKRAPKLACCPTSSTPSRQVDEEPSSGGDGSSQCVLGFASFGGIPSSSSLTPDARWWLLLQPNFGYQKDLRHELLLNSLEAETEFPHKNSFDSASECSGTSLLEGEINKFVDTSPSSRTDLRSRKQDVKALSSEKGQRLDVTEHYDIKEIDLFGCSACKQPDDLCFDSDSVWFGSDKSEPWWRVTYGDTLASFVAQKSVDHVENCDLPPQELHGHGDPFTANRWNQSGSDSYLRGCMQEISLIEGTHGRQVNFVEESRAVCPPSKPSSCHRKGSSMQAEAFQADTTKAQLLEALCHSQTRAREAEEEAKKAKAEKEHVIKLFLKQAYLLFAYKQHFQLLQNNRNNGQPVTFFAGIFPRMPLNERKLRKRWEKASKRKSRKRVRLIYGISSYTLAFALGFTLGAGLLLGWTLGWLLPGL